MPVSTETGGIAEARELLKEFEKSPGLSKKSCFSEAIEILNNFLAEHPDSEFSERANNLKNTYTEELIKRLGATCFSNPDDWLKTITWLIELEFHSERETVLKKHPELEKDWRKFLDRWGHELGEEFAKVLKLLHRINIESCPTNTNENH
jgi:hypothetical protein